MTRLRAAAGALNQTPFDWENNRQNVLDAIEAARKENVSVLCLPEMCLTGYGCEDMFLSLGLQENSLAVLKEIVPYTHGMIVSVGLPLFHRSAVFNAVCVIVDGRIAGFVAKRFLCGDGLHYEPRWFKPWPQQVRDSFEIDGVEYPIGDLVFDCGGVKIGFEICEDAWGSARPGGNMSPMGVDLILNPSASHFAFGKAEVRQRMVLESSRAFNVSYVYANLLGNEAGRIIYDGDSLIASGGELLAVGRRFSFLPSLIASAVIDTNVTRMKSARLASFHPDLIDDNPLEIKCAFDWPSIDPELSKPAPSIWEHSPNIKEEEFVRALTLGLFDYLRKTRSQGFIVSLSGGADSSAVSCLAALMIDFAYRELGEEGFNKRLGYVPGLAEAKTQKERVRRLLHCVYQATRNSSDATRFAATSLAEALGAEMTCIEIDELVDRYVSTIESALDRKLTWQRDDLALQNIQARVRGPSVWLLANVKNALLLSTSNRSEAAVGYATMDGDTCGGLCPIAGIDKAFLLTWLSWLETVGPAGLYPIPALAPVTHSPPTAELRPPTSMQTDEADLMPYRVLDVIERFAIRDKLPPREILQLARGQFPQYSAEQMIEWIKRFFRLWRRNQWKRERYAPSFHLDDENLDPKTWCRFPILCGDFQRELDEMS